MATEPNQQQIYRDKVQAELNKLNAQVDEMKAKAAQAQADVKIHYNSLLEELQTKQVAVQKKLEELQAASQDAWEDIKIGVEAAWLDLQQSFQNAVAKFDQK
ncbi:hypothetical protein [Coleofasciculus chthonoplastes]|jgi:chromosome segregation ATPase|uniref:hypothetical protein n=1 Tax=Coleofasciculus chthonoplastes TaxID=64178 RepID=UPI0032F3D520